MSSHFGPTEKYSMPTLLLTVAFSFLAIAVLAGLDQVSDNPYLIASFGATAVLVFGAPKAEFSHPKNVFFGHLFSALIGVTVAYSFNILGMLDDLRWLACAVSVSVSILAMMLTGTIHPPGGATALICTISGYTSLVYVFRPIMLGVVTLLILALMLHEIGVHFGRKGPEES